MIGSTRGESLTRPRLVEERDGFALLPSHKGTRVRGVFFVRLITPWDVMTLALLTC